MSTAFGDKVKAATKQGNFHQKTYIWKGKKEKDAKGNFVQDSYVMMDADENQLRQWYNYCNSMLYNQDKKNPGRRTLLNIIQSQKDSIGVELFLRESEKEGSTRFTIREAINKLILVNGLSTEDLKTCVLGDFMNVRQQYTNLPIKLIQDGCILKLGKFDKSHITLTFTLKQGYRLTSDEELELTEFEYNEEGDQIKRNYNEVIRERLGIADHMPLKLDPKGLTYTELRAMINLKSKYYNELNDQQLYTLRNRILFSLEDDVLFHIDQWEKRSKQILEVADIKGFTL